jgi:mono/diheme cytochrome c family protein
MVSRKVIAIGSTLGVTAFIAVLVVLSLSGGKDDYTPTTDDPAVVFSEACARCHNERGLGGRGIGPRLAGKAVSTEQVHKNVTEGEGRMPRFPNLRGQALANLERYVNGL